MKTIYTIIAILLFLSYGEAITLKIATVAPEGSIWMVELRKLNKELQRKTHGKVRFRIYAGGIAGEEKSVVKKMQLGVLDGAAFAGTGLGELMSHVRILEIPFFYRDYDEWEYMYRKLTPRFEKSFAKKGYVILGWTEAGFAYLFSKNPIQTLAQFRKAKVWFYGDDPLIEACFKELKASGVPLGLADVVTSLQTGKIDCVYCPPYGLLVMRWHTQIHYCTYAPIVNVLGGIVLTKKAYRRIPRVYRKKLKRICKKYIKSLQRKIQKANKDTIAQLKKKYQVRFIPAKESMLKELKTFSTKIAKSQVGVLYPAELLTETYKLLKEYRARK